MQRHVKYVREDLFGTSLASIHSDSDMDEARASCKGLTSGTGCWIEMNDIAKRHDYKWDDGTEFDYGTIFKHGIIHNLVFL